MGSYNMGVKKGNLFIRIKDMKESQWEMTAEVKLAKQMNMLRQNWKLLFDSESNGQRTWKGETEQRSRPTRQNCSRMILLSYKICVRIEKLELQDISEKEIGIFQIWGWQCLQWEQVDKGGTLTIWFRTTFFEWYAHKNRKLWGRA